MRPAGFSIIAGKITAAVLLFAALQGRAGWSQEIPPPKLDEERVKQEKIYRSQGTEVPAGYVIGRGLADYASLLPSGFCETLQKLGSSDRWLDIGAGAAQAILDYHAPEGEAVSPKNCLPPGARASAVAISIEDRRTDKWREQAARLGDRIQYLFGKRLRGYSLEELGKFQLITDVFGGFTYTENLSRFMQQVLSLLEPSGVFYTLLPGVHLEHAKEKLGILYLTELEDSIGRRLKVCSWLKQTTCAQVACDSKSEWKRPTELISVRKVCDNVSVPRMKLVEFEAGYPPSRRFQLEQ